MNSSYVQLRETTVWDLRWHDAIESRPFKDILLIEDNSNIVMVVVVVLIIIVITTTLTVRAPVYYTLLWQM